MNLRNLSSLFLAICVHGIAFFALSHFLVTPKADKKTQEIDLAVFTAYLAPKPTKIEPPINPVVEKVPPPEKIVEPKKNEEKTEDKVEDTKPEEPPINPIVEKITPQEPEQPEKTIEPKKVEEKPATKTAETPINPVVEKIPPLVKKPLVPQTQAQPKIIEQKKEQPLVKKQKVEKKNKKTTKKKVKKKVSQKPKKKPKKKTKQKKKKKVKKKPAKKVKQTKKQTPKKVTRKKTSGSDVGWKTSNNQPAVKTKPAKVTKPQQKLSPTSPPKPQQVKKRANGAEVSAYRSGLRRTIERKKRYPSSAQRRRKQGTVVVVFSLSASGAISNARVAKSSGNAALDNAALTAVRRVGTYKPRPAGMGGSVRVPITFKL